MSTQESPASGVGQAAPADSIGVCRANRSAGRACPTRWLSCLLLLLCLSLAADEPEERVTAWLAKQAEVRTWSAEVTQRRKLKSLARPLESKGQVWFAQPNRFRWQLGDPPRTIAVRTDDELLVAYPRLKQVERYPMTGDLDPSWQQVLALLEIGFPSDPEAFYETYEVVSVSSSDSGWQMELRPAAKQARRLIELLRLELSATDELLSTELEFPDGSTMKNEFSEHRTNPELEESLFGVEVGEGWEEVNPLAGKG